MAITFVLVSQGSNHLVYLATSSGGEQGADDIGIIQNRAPATGDANVDLAAAAVPPASAPYNAGLLKELVDQTVTTDTIARRKMLDWGLGAVSDGLDYVPGKRLRATVEEQICPTADGRTDDLKAWGIDARSDGEATPYGEYVVTCSETGTARALVRIEAIGTPQQF